LLEEAVSHELQGKFGIYTTGKKDEVQVDTDERMVNLTVEERSYRKDLLDHLEHIKALSHKPKDALAQLIREIAFTHLNRLCAYKMMEAREVYVKGQKFREAVSRGLNSNGVKFFLAEHPDDERLFNTGHQDIAYRHFLDWLGAQLSEEIGVLFNPNDPANRLYPRQKTLDDVLALINDEELAGIWSQDETIGWVYQYFTPKELRDQARKESQAPRNSYELAFRNQFFTPRYVVEFLTDNTLGRIWYEMRKGNTRLKDECRYMVRRPSEVFLSEGQAPTEDADKDIADLSQDQLFRQPVYVPHRPKKDPREIKIVDPACGSGHFLLYCYALLLIIYEEAYVDSDLGAVLQRDYPTLDALRRDMPSLILAHNLHGIDIDLRCTQIAALALWLRCQRAYQEMGLRKDRPRISRSNVVCAEPMPGEGYMLDEFVAHIEPKLLGQLVEVVFDKMKLASEAGSLLKIEEEIRDTVAEARRQWRVGPVATQLRLFGETEPVDKQQRFDLSGITDAQFFEQAEAKVVDALRSYAKHAQDGERLQRQLFADDAVQGFGFVDLCHDQFDVVLMNPPFGEGTKASADYLATALPSTKDDLATQFADRFSHRLLPRGRLGVLSTRTWLFIKRFEHWRQYLLRHYSLSVFGDLGYGVLDAVVETVAAVWENSDRPGETTFISALREGDKAGSLLSPLHSFRIEQSTFIPLPLSVFAYWIPKPLLEWYLRQPRADSSVAAGLHGISTCDNFRFLRLSWEVPPSLLSYTDHLSQTHGGWVPIAKGGEYRPYHDDIHLLVDWRDDGAAIKEHVITQYPYLNGNWGRVIINHERYFKPGLTWSYRTTSAFCLKLLPAGCVFSDGGWGMFPVEESLRYPLLAIYNSGLGRYFLEIPLGQGDTSASGTAARNYSTEPVSAVPFVFSNASTIESGTTKNIEWQRQQDSIDETTRLFVFPLAVEGEESLVKTVLEQHKAYLRGCLAALEASSESLRTLENQTELRSELLDSIYEQEGCHPCRFGWRDVELDPLVRRLYEGPIDTLVDYASQQVGGLRYIVKKAYYADRRIELLAHLLNSHPGHIINSAIHDEWLPLGAVNDFATSTISYVVGVVIGRWNVCVRRDARAVIGKHEAWDAFPLCPPGMLQSIDGRPATETPEGYPLGINWSGILVDDPDHPDDIIRGVRDVLEVIWKDRGDAVEKEACEILGVADVRDYFRKPGPGGFWDDHVKRYSKSRRKAPIYWLLQSSKKNYALWTYYHRLDKDILFKALLNYVEPKIRREESRLDELRSQKTALGPAAKGTKKIDKEIERQEAFLSELRDFEDKLRRAANLHLEPDLNDGVVLNIAPLWELVPWKEAKSYWDDLIKGEYEWSSIGKQLRVKGLVPC